MPLGTEVGLGPDHIVLDRDRSPPRKGAQQPLLSRFTDAGKACRGMRPYKPRPMSIVAKQLNGSGIRMPLSTDIGLDPGDIVLYGDPALPLS